MRRLSPAFLAGLAVAGATLAVFAPIVGHGFVSWDDKTFLLDIVYWRGLGPANLRWMFSTTYNGIYQPLPWLSFAADHALWGLNPAGFHLTSLLLHAANALLAWRLILRLAAPRAERGRPEALAAAAFGALLFSLHPLRVEPVAWASQRRDLLCAFFFLAALLAHLRSAEEGPRASPLGRRLGWVLALLALLSKGTAAVLPAVILVLDVYPLGRLPADPRLWASAPARRVLAEEVPYFLFAAGAALLAVLAHGSSTGFVSFAEFGLRARVGQALLGPSFYLAKTLLPRGLSPLYEFSPLLDPAAYAAGAAATLGLTALAWSQRGSRPWFSAAWLCYVLILLPTLGLLKFGRHTAADRYTYLAALPWAVLAAAAARRALAALPEPRARRALLAGGALLAAALGALSLAQERAWADSESLWRRAAETDSRSYFARGNLAGALSDKGRLGEAAEAAESARRIKAEVFLSAGRLLADRGENERALRYLLKAQEADPHSPEVTDLLGHLGGAPR